ncbi:MAG: helix-turn-helix domain-containing protein [Alcaligenaceae bacterium]
MRQQIDCAVLRLAAHRRWLEDVLLCAAPSLNRIKLHQLEWEAGQDLEVSLDQAVALPAQALAQAGVSLRRFDLCLVPVSLDTLAWTRQALSMIPRGPFLPLVGIFQDLRSAAMQDLLELGMADFVRLPLCRDEFRARVLSTVARVPRLGTLREPELAYGALDGPVMPQTGYESLVEAGRCAQPSLRAQTVKTKTDRVKAKQLAHDRLSTKHAQFGLVEGNSFREAKSSLVREFERDYISHALLKHNGNIAMAARASNKHRRAFWALMRKHEIEAELYRSDDGQE